MATLSQDLEPHAGGALARVSSQGLEEQALTQGPGRRRWRRGGLAHWAGAVRRPRKDGWEAAPLAAVSRLPGGSFPSPDGQMITITLPFMHCQALP